MTPKKMFFTLLGISVAMIATGTGLYFYFNNSLVALNDEVGKLLAEQEVIQTQIWTYEQTEKQVDELAFVAELADDVLPDSKEQANVVAEIRQFVSSAGLTLESLNFSNTAATNTGLSNSQTEAVANLLGVRVLPVTVVVAPGASYADALTLLRTIESNQRKMQVTEIALTPQPGTDRIAAFSLKLNIYLRGGVVTQQQVDATTPEGEQ